MIDFYERTCIMHIYRSFASLDACQLLLQYVIANLNLKGSSFFIHPVGIRGSLHESGLIFIPERPLKFNPCLHRRLS